ncbi:hypothetical protein [Clostridium psychrophilum]|uniref:hypothetical protein n=1 Tax=Clostridium psychrophilum TaxID=132926 RepID=UPI001C0E4C47|nr:hypothetical protein [Clostridium psychrophilum]MBU3182219.1 hypothetical protein [Clostridium psychrophilum]
MLSFVWGKMIAGYRETGQSYGEIFKHLYTFEAIIVIGVFIIIMLLQKGVTISKRELIQNEL